MHYQVISPIKHTVAVLCQLLHYRTRREAVLSVNGFALGIAQPTGPS